MRRMVVIFTLYIVFLTAFVFSDMCQTQVSLLGPPTVGSLLGESVA
jgi:hypothetical protein